MNFFLSDEQYHRLNKCTVSNAEVRIAVNKKPYIVVEFSRKPETVFGRRLYFAPHDEFFFDYDSLRQFCDLFDPEHILVESVSGMNLTRLSEFVQNCQIFLMREFTTQASELLESNRNKFLKIKTTFELYLF